MGALSLVCAIPGVGDVIGAVRYGTKLAKVAKAVGNAVRMAQKAYVTVASAETALELAGDAKMEYAVNGGEMTGSIMAKKFGAVALAGLAVISGKSLVKDVSSLAKIADVHFSTRSKETADVASGKEASKANKALGAFGNKSGKTAALKLGNSQKVIQSFTRDDIIKSLDGVTEKSTQIANGLRNGKIKLNVLGDELFESYLGCSSDTMAMQVGNQIYVRRSSSCIFSDVVHEGTHAIDFINNVPQSEISSWTGETRAYSAERFFQIKSGMPIQFKNKEDMMIHIWSNYKR